MKTVIVAAFAASFGIAALAQTAFDEQGLTPEEVAQHRARMARKAQRAAENGGYVTLAPTGRVVRVVSAQRRAAKSALDESINVFTTTLRLPVEWGDVDGIYNVLVPALEKVLTDDELEKMCNGNFLRVLAENEK